MRTNSTQLCSSVVVIGLALSGLAWGAAPQPNAGWWMLDEGSGTVAQDRSGNGRHGTIEGAPPWTRPGWEGWGACLKFGGDAARVNVESFDVTGTGITLAGTTGRESRMISAESTRKSCANPEERRAAKTTIKTGSRRANHAYSNVHV